MSTGADDQTGVKLLALLRQVDVGSTQRSRAILVAGTHPTPELVTQLVAMLSTEQDPYLREDITWALKQAGGLAVSPLLAALSHADASVRHQLVHTLGKIASPEAFKALTLATQDADAGVRYKAVQALAQLGNPQAIPVLIPCLGDPNLEVRWMARDALEQFGVESALPLISSLHAENGLIRALAASILGHLGVAAAVDSLWQLLEEDTPEVRIAALEALIAIDPAWLSAHRDALLKDESPQIRALARRFLA